MLVIDVGMGRRRGAVRILSVAVVCNDLLKVGRAQLDWMSAIVCSSSSSSSSSEEEEEEERMSVRPKPYCDSDGNSHTEGILPAKELWW